MKKKLGEVYSVICFWMKVRADGRKYIHRHDICRILGELFHVPKEKRVLVMKEMELSGFIKRVDRDMFCVLVG